MPVFMDAAATRHFSKKFDNVRESTVKSIKTVYLQVIKKELIVILKTFSFFQQKSGAMEFCLVKS